MEREAQAGRGHWPTTLVVAGVALGLAAALRRYTAHGSDVFFFLLRLEDDIVLAQHPLVLVMARGFRELVLPFTDDRMTALAWFSAVGVAVGIGALHRAALWLRPARQARWLAVGALVTPGVAFFATIGELPGPFFGAAGIAILAGARWWARGGVVAAVVTGAATAFAALMHGSGHVLVLLMALAWLTGLLPPQGSSAWRRRASLVVVFVATHAVVYAMTRAAILAGATEAAGGAEVGGAVAVWLSPAWWFTSLPHAIATQWYVAFAPWSWLALLAFFGRDSWRAGVALHAAVLAYAGLSATIAPGVDEVGGYCLPLVFGAVLVGFDRLPARWWWAAVVAGGLAVASDRCWRPMIAPDFAFGETVYASKGGADRAWLVGDERESMGARWRNRRPELIEAWITVVDLELRSGGDAAGVSEQLLMAWLEVTRQQTLATRDELVVSEFAVAALSRRLPAFAGAWQKFIAVHPPEPLVGVAGWRGHVFARD